MAERADVSQLEATLDYRFEQPAHLIRALTHRSVWHSHKPAPEHSLEDNEQLEFLGDSVLGFLVAEALVTQFAQDREGVLSKRKSFLVSAGHLAHVAQRVRLGDYLVMSKGEDALGGRGKAAILANAVEALIAALYLDGGMEPARAFVSRFVLDEDLDAEEMELADAKSTLQELAQAHKLALPNYSLIATIGPAHAMRFLIEARLGEWSSQAEGSSKKQASQLAARRLLDLVQQHLT